MVEKRVRQVKIETVEKRGKVFNAYDTFENFDKLKSKEDKDFGQVDFTDKEIEETIKRDKARNRHLDNTQRFLKGFRK